MKVGEYYYEPKGKNYAIYVVEKITPPAENTSSNMRGLREGPLIHCRKVEEHFTPEAARRRVYELNGWKNYKPLKSV